MKNFSPATPFRPARSLAALALLLAAAGAAQAQTPASFGAVSTYPTGNFPLGVAVADVNGDGRPDLVTADSGSNTVSVLLGQAGGSFASPTAYGAGANSQPVGVTVADVNADGRPDILTSNVGSSTIGVLLALAGGGFAPVNLYASGTSRGPGNVPVGVAVADVNADGRPDLVTANYVANTVSVLLGQAGGGFAARTAYGAGGNSQPTGVAIADVNADGRPDILTANAGSSTVGVLLSQAGGGFASGSITYPAGASSQPVGVAVADVNADGRPDILTANNGGHTAGVLLGQAGGGFAAASIYYCGVNSPPQAISLGDVNGDQRPDIILVNYNGTVSVLLGQAGGSFATAVLYQTGANGFSSAVAVADVNGDGRPDIVTANYGNTNSAGVLLNTGTFTPLAAAPGAAAADVALFPNPARDGFAVQLPAAWGPGPARAELLNALGQVVAARATAGGAALTFATQGLAPGVYLLRVRADGHALTKRVALD